MIYVYFVFDALNLSDEKKRILLNATNNVWCLWKSVQEQQTKQK